MKSIIVCLAVISCVGGVVLGSVSHNSLTVMLLASLYVPTVVGMSIWLLRLLRRQQIDARDAFGKVTAINRSQAVIEFNMDGQIRFANDNFLQTLGYTLPEIVGQHHSMFVEESYKSSREYAEFWTKLRRGEFCAAEFKRVGKHGKVVWIQASYNPIFDEAGQPVSVVKFAVDITAQVNQREDLKSKVATILDVVSRAAEGDLTHSIQVRGTDAIGQMGEGLETFFCDLRQSIISIAENATTLAGASDELAAVSSQMSGNATETSSQANVVSAASEQVSQNLQTVSTGVEEMNSAILEIAKSASEAAKVSQQAVSVANSTNIWAS